MWRLPHAEGLRRHRHGRPESRRRQALARPRGRPAPEREGRDAAVPSLAHGQGARRCRGLRRPGVARGLIDLPKSFPRDVEAIATDLDHTLMWTDGALRPRTLSALARTRDAGLPVIVATGRMVQSLRRVLDPVGLRDPVICYQGAVVVDSDGEWLLHVPIEVELARDAIAAVEVEAYHPNVYVGDELYVSRVTPQSEAYADFQRIPIH